MTLDPKHNAATVPDMVPSLGPAAAPTVETGHPSGPSMPGSGCRSGISKSKEDVFATSSGCDGNADAQDNAPHCRRRQRSHCDQVPAGALANASFVH